MIATVVVQEGKVFFKSRWPAAGPIADLVLSALLLEAPSKHHVPHGDVIIVPLGCAFAAAVAQQHCLIAVIAKTQFTHSQLQLPYGAGFRPAGSFSPTGLLLVHTPASPTLPLEQLSYHMLKLALCEALEHHGN